MRGWLKPLLAGQEFIGTHITDQHLIPRIPVVNAGISLGMRPVNERRRYIVTTSLIGWTHTLTDACKGCRDFQATL